MTNSKCIPMYILVHNLNRVLFNTNVHTYTASPVLYYYQKIAYQIFKNEGFFWITLYTPLDQFRSIFVNIL